MRSPASFPFPRLWPRPQAVPNSNRRLAGRGPMHLPSNSSSPCSLFSPLLLRRFCSRPGKLSAKPITLVVPFGAGGALDLIARVLADGLRATSSARPSWSTTSPARAGSSACCQAAGRRAGRPDHHSVEREQPRPAAAAGRELSARRHQGFRAGLAVRPVPAHAHREEGAAGRDRAGAGGVSARQSGQAVIRLVRRRHQAAHRQANI